MASLEVCDLVRNLRAKMEAKVAMTWARVYLDGEGRKKKSRKRVEKSRRIKRRKRRKRMRRMMRGTKGKESIKRKKKRFDRICQ